MSERSTTADNGNDARGAGDKRAPDGRFAPGNKIARGNPHAKRVAQLRATMMRAVTQKDMRAIVKKLVELAKDGHVQAAKEILERCMGKSEAVDVLARIEQLEETLSKETN